MVLKVLDPRLRGDDKITCVDTSNEVGITSLLIGCRHAAYWRFLRVHQNSRFKIHPYALLPQQCTRHDGIFPETVQNMIEGSVQILVSQRVGVGTAEE